MKKNDVVIVGGGPGGTCTALHLAEHGISSTIVERVQFPRYHIGESMTGECGAAIRRLGLEAEMLQRNHPVKYGVSVYGPDGKNTFWVPVMKRGEDGGLHEASTWQVRRSEFDKMLLDEAAKRGSTVIEGSAVDVIKTDGRVEGVRVKTVDGEVSDIHARVVVDASGQSTFLARCGLTSEKHRGNYDSQIAIFSQVSGAVRDDGPAGGNTLIFYKQKNHWAWFIPIDDDVVSVGVVVPNEHFKATGESLHDFLVRELKELHPEFVARLQHSELVEDVRACSNYSYDIDRFTGPGYLCVGDSHRFVDPVFSFGLHFAVKEAEFAASAIVDYLNGRTENEANPFAEYERLATGGMDVIQDLIDCFWDHPLPFVLITHMKHREDMIDLFAGRVYLNNEPKGLTALRDVLEVQREAV